MTSRVLGLVRDSVLAHLFGAVLRGVSGYMIASRVTAGSGASNFDRIMILPTSTAPRLGNAPAPLPPRVLPPVQLDQDAEIDLDDDTADALQANRPNPGNPRERAVRPLLPPVVNGPSQPFQPEPDDDTEPQAPVPTPGNPFGVVSGTVRPGVITPPPTDPKK